MSANSLAADAQEGIAPSSRSARRAGAARNHNLIRYVRNRRLRLPSAGMTTRRSPTRAAAGGSERQRARAFGAAGRDSALTPWRPLDRPSPSREPQGSPQRLGHISQVGNGQLQDSRARGAARHAEPLQLEAAHDLPRRPNDHQDTEPQAHAHPPARNGSRRQQRKRVVVARLRLGGSFDVTTRDAVERGPIVRCVGRNVSHPAAERAPPFQTIRGRPRRSRRNPARDTSTATRLVPEFRTCKIVRAFPASITRAGVAVSATGRVPRSRPRMRARARGRERRRGYGN